MRSMARRKKQATVSADALGSNAGASDQCDDLSSFVLRDLTDQELAIALKCVVDAGDIVRCSAVSKQWQRVSLMVSS